MDPVNVGKPAWFGTSSRIGNTTEAITLPDANMTQTRLATWPEQQNHDTTTTQHLKLYSIPLLKKASMGFTPNQRT